MLPSTHRAYVTLSREPPPRWRARRPALPHIDLELTERCNNDCVHCSINRPASDAEARARELSADAWQDVLRQAAALGALSVRFTGGEPLLREDFDDLYVFARRQGLQVVLFTNARLITPARADLFARYPPGPPIEISIYGMTPATSASITRDPAAFDASRNGIACLLARQVPFVVKGVYLPPMRPEWDAFETWARALPGMHNEPPGCVMSLDLRGRRDAEARNRRIAALRPPAATHLSFAHRQETAYRREMAAYCRRFMRPGGNRLFDCGAVCGGSVDAYGRLQVCLELRDPSWTYDLTRGTLQDGLRQLRQRARKARSTNPKYLSTCARCFIKGLCEQCPGKAWSEHGTLDTPVAYHCDLAHAAARDLGLLAHNEQAWNITDASARVRRMEAACA